MSKRKPSMLAARRTPSLSPAPDQTTSKSPLLSDSDIESTGRFCGYCVQALTADRDGSNLRHLSTGVPYGQCIAASRPPSPPTGQEIIPDSIYEAAVDLNDRNRAVLDAFDSLDRRNWEYYPAADGNKARHVYIPRKGLK